MIENEVVEEIYKRAVIICYKYPNAKYLILSRAAYYELKKHCDIFIVIGFDYKTFMGKQIAFIEDDENIIIDIGGIN